MKIKSASKQSNLTRFISAPIRILSKARDFYMNSLMNCSNKISYGGSVGPVTHHVSHLPKSFSINSTTSSSSNEEEFRMLLRMVSKRNNNVERYTATRPMNRSYSVGLGKIGRIDEDKPCEFEEDDDSDDVNMRAGFMYPRSRSYAVKRNIGTM